MDTVYTPTRGRLPKHLQHEGGLGNLSSCVNCKALITLIGYGWDSSHTIWTEGWWITRWVDRFIPCPAKVGVTANV